MTDTEIVETLAERDGWKREGVHWKAPGRGFLYDEPLDYTKSLDALQPILQGLSDEEWRGLYNALELPWPAPLRAWSTTQWLLTIDTRMLAEKMAEVLREKEAL